MTFAASKTEELREIFVSIGLQRLKALRLIHGGSGLRHEFDISAEDFLQRAEDDFELRGEAAILNAVANAKRAIHAQVDEVLHALGYPTKGRGFDKRLALFGDLGFVAPRILKRINDARNILEHEYTKPTLEQVEEAIDLATLFIGATRRHSESWEDEFTIGNCDEQLDEFTFGREISVSFEHKLKIFHVDGWVGCVPLDGSPANINEKAKLIGRIELSANEPVFTDLVRLIIAGDHERKSREALDLLFDRIQM